MNPIFALIVQLVLGVLTQGPSAIRQLVDIGEQSGALTPDQAAQFRRDIDAAFASPRWQTDAQRAAGGGEATTVPGTGGGV